MEIMNLNNEKELKGARGRYWTRGTEEIEEGRGLGSDSTGKIEEEEK